jgi:hypothetical protein
MKGGKMLGKIQGNTNICQSPMESPISVIGESPYGQVDFLLDTRPL